MLDSVRRLEPKSKRSGVRTSPQSVSVRTHGSHHSRACSNPALAVAPGAWVMVKSARAVAATQLWRRRGRDDQRATLGTGLRAAVLRFPILDRGGSRRLEVFRGNAIGQLLDHPGPIQIAAELSLQWRRDDNRASL